MNGRARWVGRVIGNVALGLAFMAVILGVCGALVLAAAWLWRSVGLTDETFGWLITAAAGIFVPYCLYQIGKELRR